MLSRTVGEQLPTYAAQHPRRAKALVTLPRKPEISHTGCFQNPDGTRLVQPRNNNLCAKSFSLSLSLSVQLHSLLHSNLNIIVPLTNCHDALLQNFLPSRFFTGMSHLVIVVKSAVEKKHYLCTLVTYNSACLGLLWLYRLYIVCKSDRSYCPMFATRGLLCASHLA
jgi:hypothetical protein